MVALRDTILASTIFVFMVRDTKFCVPTIFSLKKYYTSIILTFKLVNKRFFVKTVNPWLCL